MNWDSKGKVIAIGAAAGLAFGMVTAAQNMTRDEYKASRQRIQAEYKADQTNCKSLLGNAKDICIVEAKGKMKIAKAELEESYRPTLKNQYDVSVAKADAEYGVAKKKCDNQPRNAKDVCRQEAKAAKISAKVDAKSKLKIAAANKTELEKTVEAHQVVAENQRDTTMLSLEKSARVTPQ